MAERSIAAVLKTVDLRGSGGSNPSLSAQSTNSPPQGRGVKKLINMKKMMKVFAAMFCAAMVFVLTGCSKENFDEDIIGTWDAISMRFVSTNAPLPELNYDDTMPFEPGTSWMVFNSDKTGLSYTFDSEEGVTNEYAFTWNIKDETLTINFNLGDYTWPSVLHIDKLKDGTMVLSENNTYEDSYEDGNGQQQTYTATETVYYTYNKR